MFGGRPIGGLGVPTQKAKDFKGAAERFERAQNLFVAAGSPLPSTIRFGLARADLAHMPEATIPRRQTGARSSRLED